MLRFRKRSDDRGRAPGWLMLGVLAWLAGASGSAWAQPTNDNFASAEVITGLWGAVTNDTTDATAEPLEPSHAGLPASGTVWYEWVAPRDGEVQLDTLSSPQGSDTVLAVYTGETLGRLRQVAANDDQFPFVQQNMIGIIQGNLVGSAYVTQPFNGPSALRFNARAGTTYYFAVGNGIMSLGGPFIFGWAYHSGGVFRFATEDAVASFDPVTFQFLTVPVYRCSEWESIATENASTFETYYPFGVPGTLVTVTRVGGSSGRMLVDYATADLATPLPSDALAVAGLDYIPVQGTLVFDDFEMTKRILIQIQPDFMMPQTNRDFAVLLSNARPDPIESPEVSAPRIDGAYGQAIVRILDTDIDPIMVRNFTEDTNSPTGYIFGPTNSVFNFARVAYRTVEDVNSYWSEVHIWVERSGRETKGETVHYRLNNYLLAGDNADLAELDNCEFALQPGSDYATPTPADDANGNSQTGVHSTNADFTMGGNYGFPGGGTLSWGDRDFRAKEITLTITNDAFTEFNEDFHLFLYKNFSDDPFYGDGPGLVGTVNETAVTILFDDQDPPAGSVDQMHNADWGVRMVPPVTTVPPNQARPGADNAVYDLFVQGDSKTIIVGDFQSYNATPRNRIARLNQNGSLDTSFDPSGGANNSIRALVPTIGGRYIVGGEFTSYSGAPRVRVARITANGALDASFIPGDGPDAVVQALAAQSDGKVLIGGEFISVNGVARAHIARLNGDGSLDATFDPGVSGPDGTVWAVALQSDGKVVIGGDFRTIAGQTVGGIARLNTDGTLDTTFDPGSGTDGTVYAVTVQTDGKILVGGDFSTMNGNPRRNLARLNGDGALDLTFDPASTGADNIVFSITQSGGSLYVGGAFTSYNSTHRRGLVRLFMDGTVDTSFLDTAYNQFAGLHRARFIDPPGIVYALGIQPDGNVMIGGSFTQVGGGQADLIVRPDTADVNLWSEPKARDGVRTRLNVARLLGGATPGPGNINITADTHTANENQSYLSVSLTRNNGTLGFLSANFEVEEGFAQAGVDYIYNAVPPIYLSSWLGATWLNFTASEPNSWTYMHSDGLFGDNFTPSDTYGHDWYQYTPGQLIITMLNDSLMQGNRNTSFRLSNPTAADQFFLGGENIPLGGALGHAQAPLTIIDDDQKYGVLTFASANYVVGEGVGNAVVTVIRTNGSYGNVSCSYSTVSGGTTTSNLDYTIKTGTLIFSSGQTSNTFKIPILDDPAVELDETIFIQLSLPSTYTSLGLSNAVVTIVDNDTPGGKLNFSSAIFGTSESTGNAVITVTRSGSSAGSLTVQAVATNGTALAGSDFIGVTNVLSWGDGDVTNRTFVVPLLDDTAVEPNETVSLRLLNPTRNSSPNPATLGPVSSATLVITNDDLRGLLAFSTAVYNANENGGPAIITVVRTGGSAESATVSFAAVGGTAFPGFDFQPTNGTLTFGPGELSKSFAVPVLDNGDKDGTRFVTLLLSNAQPAGVLGSPATSILNLIDDESVNEPPGGLDTLFTPSGANDAVFALALQSDGKILAGGDFTQVNLMPRVRLVRLLSLDGTVEEAGANGFEASANGTVRAITPQADGRVLVGGSFTAINGVTRNRISRLNTNGTLDTVFDPGSGVDGTVFGLAETFVNGERKVLVGGTFTVVNGIPRNGIARLNNDGSLDSGFITGVGLNGAVYAVAVYPANTQNAGKAIIGGDFTTVNGVPRARVARLNVDGSLDASFDPGTGASDAVRALAIQPDGRVLIGGSFTNFNGAAFNRFARLKEDGSVDATFKPGVGANDTVNTIVVQGDTRIVLGGQFTRCSGVTRYRLTRLYNDGTVDPTINFGGANSFVAASVVQPDGKIIIGGGFTDYDGTPRRGIARIYGGSVAGSGTFEFTAATYQADENSTNATITVRRRGGTSAPTGATNITVYTVASDGTATNGIHYIGGTNILDFPPGEVLLSFLVPLIDDYEVNAARTVNLSLADILPAGQAGYANQPTAVLKTIINDDSAISFSAPTFTRNENSINGRATITVIRMGSTLGTASVDFTTTTNGTATPLLDFTPTTNSVVFTPGETSKSIFIPIVNDTLIEGDETVTMELTNVIGALLFEPSEATLTIVDDDFAPGQIGFALLSYAVSEDAGNAVISLVRTNGRSGSVSASFYTSDGTATAGADYTGVSGTVVFGEGETNKNILVPITNDVLVEGPEQFTITLTNLTGGAAILGTNSAAVTIVDDEIGVSFSSPAYIAEESGGNVTITVLRVSGSNGVATVHYATTNGTATAGEDYLATSGTLTFNNGETLKTFTVPVLEDTIVEGDETFGVLLSNPSSGVQLLNAVASVAIIDNDAGISFATNSCVVTEWSTNGVSTNAVLEVVRTGSLNGTVSVTYGTQSGTAIAGQDFTPVGGQLTFTNSEVRKTITIPITNDTQVEDSETFTVTLSSPSGGAVLAGESVATVTIVDNDAGIRFSSPSYVISEGGVQAIITVLRSNILDTVVSVKYATNDGTAVNGVNYVQAQGTLVFTNGETVKTFAVPLIDNTLEQGTLTVNLLLSGVTGQASLVTPSAAVLSIVDNDGGVIVPAGSKLTSDPNGNGAIDPGETVTVLFALRDASVVNTTNLVATLLTTNGVSSPSGAKSYGALVAGGASVSREFTFTASGTNGSLIHPTFQLQDGATGFGRVAFTYLLGTTTALFTNSGTVTILEQGPAAPYPSTISVTGIVGVVSKTVVTLTNLAHTFPDDIDMLLVSPGGQKMILMSDVGGSIQITNVTLTLDDAATNSLPDPGPIVSGTFKPTNFQTDEFPAPASPGPYGSTLATFNDSNPSGDWQLFIADDSASDAGSLVRGWVLAITTGGRVPADADLSLSVAQTPPPNVVSNDLTYTLTVTNHGPWAVTGVTVTDALPPNATLVTVLPSQGTVITNGTELQWNVGSLAMDARATATITVRPLLAGTYTNTCVVSAVEADPNSGNNTTTTTTVVVSPTADLALTVFDAPDPVMVGGNITYTLIVTNIGPATALQLRITNTLPAGVTFVSATPAQYSLAGSVVTFTNLGNLASGAQKTVTITVKAMTAGTLTDSAACGSQTVDPLKGNNLASVKTVVFAPELSIGTVGGSLVVAWPADVAGFVLEQTVNLTPPVIWSAVTNPPPVLVSGQWTVTIDTSSGSSYLRLRSGNP